MKDNKGKIKLSTKADTLKSLEGRLKNAAVLSQVSFCCSDWNENQSEIISKIASEMEGGNVIVRSSAVDEDTENSSNAGKNLSIPNVMVEEEELRTTISKVFESYEIDSSDNQVLIQPMLEHVAVCGVAFTMDPNIGGEYYVINYDTSGSTDAITSGESKENLLYVYKHLPDGKATIEDKRIEVLCNALRELEELFDRNNLDVEFAFDREGKLFILQVRSLIMHCKTDDNDKPVNTGKVLEEIYRKIEDNQKKKPFLCGDSAIYSVMTDWNPAEMIGIRPRPLALSLYRELITDNIWAYQRDNYGYRNLRSFPLLVDFDGLPYIDVRVSFNSFVPASLNEELSEKLVNYYLRRLRENPLAHDKAEFDIVFSCYTFDLDSRIKVLSDYGFTETEIKEITEALREVTINITDYNNGLWRTDWKKIGILEKRYYEIIESDLSDLDKIYWLIEDCKRYGTLPFAGLARGAFIAVQMLKSAVECGIFTDNDYCMFMNSMNTISSQMKTDFAQLSKHGFLEKYGHLRPGTYDICSPRYDEKPDLYFDWSAESGEAANKKDFRLSLDQMKSLKGKLEECGLSNDVLGLLEFIKAVIEGREFSKFIFTKHVSKVLSLLKNVGKEYGFSEEEMSFTNINTILRLYSSTDDIKDFLGTSIRCGKKKATASNLITLPPVIISPNDIYSFKYPDTEPNYITIGQVIGEVIEIKGYSSEQESAYKDLEGKIVLIKSADPGYDWIFSHKIAGFITMYGGANSHMAIRAGELNIPAVVGAGEKLYHSISCSKVIEINSREKIVRILRRK